MYDAWRKQIIDLKNVHLSKLEFTIEGGNVVKYNAKLWNTFS